MSGPSPQSHKPLPGGFLDRLRAAFGDRVSTGEAVRNQHGQSETHFDIMPPDAVVELVKLCVAAEVPTVPFGAGTSMEGNILAVRGGVTVDLSQMDAILVDRALSMDGTCTGEHGIGLGKQDCLIDELSDAVDMMRNIKRAIDPKHLFNPGKIFAVQRATASEAFWRMNSTSVVCRSPIGGSN